jgi:glycosyltransferase involved in cell wall biosynthesis
MTKRIAIVGIQGVPAQYGGFESLVENIIGEHCGEGIEYTVFCSAKDYHTRLREYKGVKLRYIRGLHANGWQSILYDVCGMLACIGRGYDTVLVLGVSGCLFLPVFRWLYRGRLVVNIDGLEHRREKWSPWQRRFLRWSEAAAVRVADVIIADNRGIQQYVTETYGKPSTLIAYGGDQTQRVVSPQRQQEILQQYGLESGRYGVAVCRIEPENNCHIVLSAFASVGQPLVYVGNWMNNEYGRKLKARYDGRPGFHLVESVYDLDVLFTLRKHAKWYVHGHSAGGTNPSLVEAMFFGRPILAFDVVYNRETTCGEAYYFRSSGELVKWLEKDGLDGSRMKVIAEERYRWERIAKEYEAVYGL